MVVAMDLDESEQPLGFRFVNEEVMMVLLLLVPPFLALIILWSMLRPCVPMIHIAAK